MGPNLYDEDLLAGFTDEEKARFLAEFSPAPTNTGGAPRGFQPLAPAAPRVDTSTEGESGESEETALMRRFAEAQERGSARDSVNRWASGLGQDAANYANAGSYGRGVYRNPIERDTSLRQQPVQDVQAQEAARAQYRAQGVKEAAAARDAEADRARVDKLKVDTERAQMTTAEQEALTRVDSPETNNQRDTARALLKGKIPDDVLNRMNGHEILKNLRAGTSQVNADTIAGQRAESADLAARRQEFEESLKRAGLSMDYQRLALQQYDLELKAKQIAAQQAQTEAARSTAESGKVASDTKDIAKEFDELGGPGFYSRYAEARDIIQRHKDDLPGVGKVAGKLPSLFVSEEGNNLRSAVGQMLAEYRKSVTGAGMSNAEREEYATITGLLASTREDVYMRGVERLKKAMDARVRARARGYRPEAVAEYAEREPMFGAVMAGDAVRQSSPSGAPDVDLSAPVGSARNPSKGVSTKITPLPKPNAESWRPEDGASVPKPGKIWIQLADKKGTKKGRFEVSPKRWATLQKDQPGMYVLYEEPTP